MSDRSAEKVSTRRHAAALVSIACFVLLVLILVGTFFRHADDMTIGLLGLCAATAGGWWIITERMPRRALGIVGAAAGVVVIVVAITRALNGTDRVLVRVGIVVVLLGAMLASARAAMMHDVQRH